MCVGICVCVLYACVRAWACMCMCAYACVYIYIYMCKDYPTYTPVVVEQRGRNCHERAHQVHGELVLLVQRPAELHHVVGQNRRADHKLWLKGEKIEK